MFILNEEKPINIYYKSLQGLSVIKLNLNKENVIWQIWNYDFMA